MGGWGGLGKKVVDTKLFKIFYEWGSISKERFDIAI